MGYRKYLMKEMIFHLIMKNTTYYVIYIRFQTTENSIFD